jgi:hypothetical protein
VVVVAPETVVVVAPGAVVVVVVGGATTGPSPGTQRSTST